MLGARLMLGVAWLTLSNSQARGSDLWMLNETLFADEETCLGNF